MELTGKVCLVTGGSSGIGEATVLKLVARGANIAAVSRGGSTKLSQGFLGAIESSGATVRYYAADVANPLDCNRI